MPYLPEAVESILAQTRRDFVFLILDNGSQDGSGAYLDSVADPRLRVVHLKDFAFDRGRNPREVLPGDGGLRLRELLQALREAAFAGELVIETEAPDLSPADARARWVAAVEAPS